MEAVKGMWRYFAATLVLFLFGYAFLIGKLTIDKFYELGLVIIYSIIHTRVQGHGQKEK